MKFKVGDFVVYNKNDTFDEYCIINNIINRKYNYTVVIGVPQWLGKSYTDPVLDFERVYTLVTDRAIIDKVNKLIIFS